jgi:DNA-binding NarL/FixJ family response regulator
MSDRGLSLILVGADPIFRLGLRTTLEQAHFSILAEAETLEAAITPLEAPEDFPQVLVLWHGPGDLTANLSDSASLDFGPLLPWLSFRSKIPQAKLILLGLEIPANVTPSFKNLGVDGYCSPNIGLGALELVMEQVLQGEFPWPRPYLVVRTPSPFTPAPASGVMDWVQGWVQQLCQSGIEQIERELEAEQAALRWQANWFDRQLSVGQQRELATARWLLQRLAQTTTKFANSSTASPTTSSQSSPTLPWNLGRSSPKVGSAKPSVTPRSPDSRPSPTLNRSDSASSRGQTPGAIDVMPPLISLDLDVASPQDLQGLLFDLVSQKFQSTLTNFTPLPLEIDILSLSKKRELIVVVLRCFGDRLTDLRHSQLALEQVALHRDQVVLDLWQGALTDFFGKYATLTIEPLPKPLPPQQTVVPTNGPTPTNSPTSSNPPSTTSVLKQVELVPELIGVGKPVEEMILNRIPAVEQILQTLLFLTPVTIDGVAYRPHSPEALERLSQLLENLILQVANGIVQPLLNRFTTVETIKHTFYDKRLLSTRAMERFRNNLSWKYRFSYAFEEPQNIYESRHWLLILDDQGIRRIAIYAPRQRELDQLTRFQQTITLGLELRDAISPRLRGVTAWVGRGIVYVLTQVLGRALGLIGRGILQGIGSSWQDSRFSRK